MSDDLKAEVERLKAENEALKQKKPGARSGALTMKVSEKGALSIYGMGRFPVTLYKEQWLKLLAISDDIKKFISENDERLKTKD
ncbi:MAG: hypothetical protein AB7F86_13365 [Bdellovibrionales bacterium]